jgi:hypothetical protein
MVLEWFLFLGEPDVCNSSVSINISVTNVIGILVS